MLLLPTPLGESRLSLRESSVCMDERQDRFSTKLFLTKKDGHFCRVYRWVVNLKDVCRFRDKRFLKIYRG